jgi:hypothetical protein
MKTIRNMVLGILAIGMLCFVASSAFAGSGGDYSVDGANKKIAVAEICVAEPCIDEYYWSDFSRITVTPGYQFLQLEPGTSESFTVTVANRDNETIEFNPEVVIVPYTEYYADEDWISITPSEASIGSGDSATFDVTVTIPEDADIGSYSVLLAFTDELSKDDTMSCDPYDYPGTMNLNIEVYTPPSLLIEDSYISDRVLPGESYEYEILLKNTGESDISLDAELVSEYSDIVCYDSCCYSGLSSVSSVMWPAKSPASGDDSIAVTAPDVIKAGDSAIVTVELRVPEDATGSFSYTLDLNTDDPGMNEYQDDIYLNFRILPQPEDPYVTGFTCASNGTITIGLTSTMYGYDSYGNSPDSGRLPSFELSLESPSGKTVIPEILGTKQSSSVSLVQECYPYGIRGEETTDAYQTGSMGYEVTYRAEGEIGEWTLSILPSNTEFFDYSIEITPDAE